MWRACLGHPRYPSEAELASCIALTPLSHAGILNTCTWQSAVPWEHRKVVTNSSTWSEHIVMHTEALDVSYERLSKQPWEYCPGWDNWLQLPVILISLSRDWSNLKLSRERDFILLSQVVYYSAKISSLLQSFFHYPIAHKLLRRMGAVARI